MKTERRKETGTMRIKGGRKGKGGRGVGDRKEKIKTKKKEKMHACAWLTAPQQYRRQKLQCAQPLL